VIIKDAKLLVLRHENADPLTAVPISRTTA